MTQTFAELEHGKVHYKYEGLVDNTDAPLLIFVPGMGDSLAVYDPFVNTLLQENKYRFLRFDKWGHGATPNPGLQFTRHLFVEMLHDLLEKLNISCNFTLIGHSMGGAISCLFAAKYPDRVKELILLTPAGLTFTLPRETALLPYIPNFIAKRFAVLNSAKNFPMTDCESEIAEVGKHSRKVLILWAQNDVMISPVEVLPLWRKHFPNATIMCVRQCGHDFFFPEELPLTSTVVVTEYIKGGDLQSIREKLKAVEEVKAVQKVPSNYDEFWNSEYFRDILI
jgi:pimeloyl-ACP methyl ester carboxylesterase